MALFPLPTSQIPASSLGRHPSSNSSFILISTAHLRPGTISVLSWLLTIKCVNDSLLTLIPRMENLGFVGINEQLAEESSMANYLVS